MSAPDTRSITLVDLPLLRRLNSSVILDSELGLTGDARGAKSAILSAILFPRGVYTLVTRSETQDIVGQFRYRPEDVNAHMIYLAPSSEDEGDNTAWLHILDAMAREAGKHGAHALVAEVEQDSPVFETLRQARFATYARQTIWRHPPFKGESAASPILLKPETSTDQIGMMALMCSTIPTMLQQVTAPPSDMTGYVYRKDGQLEAYIGVTEGAQGIYLLPFIHPDVSAETGDILRAAFAKLENAHRLPVYIGIRSYQNWLESSVAALGFEHWMEQAIMVKHIAAGIQRGYHPIRVKNQLDTVNTVPHGWWCMIGDEEKDTH